MDPTLILGAAQTVLGTVQSLTGRAKANRLLGEETPYTTPQQYYKIANLTENQAQTGYDPFTLNYLTSQTNQGFSEALSTATRLGANPNDLAALFNDKVNNIMKIGAENHALNMENVGKYLNALDVLGENKAAEWKSRQDMIKDKLQAASAQQQAGGQNVFGGANAINSSLTNAKVRGLFTTPTATTKSAGDLVTDAGQNAAGNAATGGAYTPNIDYATIAGALGNITY